MSLEAGLLEAFEEHSPQGIREALAADASPANPIKRKRPIECLIEAYLRSPRFPECLQVMLDAGASLMTTQAFRPATFTPLSPGAVHTGAAVWMMKRDGRLKPGVMVALPSSIGASVLVRRVSSSPAAARKAPSTPVPGMRPVLAAFTTASSASVSMRAT